MKTFRVTLGFTSDGEAIWHVVNVQAMSKESAIQIATKPHWYEVDDNLFRPASLITEVRVQEIETKSGAV